MPVSCCTWTQLVQWPLWLQRNMHLLQQSGNPCLEFSRGDSISASACVQQTHSVPPTKVRCAHWKPLTGSEEEQSPSYTLTPCWGLHTATACSMWIFLAISALPCERGLAQCRAGPSSHTWQHLWPMLDVTINIPILTSCYGNFRGWTL